MSALGRSNRSHVKTDDAGRCGHCSILRATQFFQSLKLTFLQLRTKSGFDPRRAVPACSAPCRFGSVGGAPRWARERAGRPESEYCLRMQGVILTIVTM